MNTVDYSDSIFDPKYLRVVHIEYSSNQMAGGLCVFDGDCRTRCCNKGKCCDTEDCIVARSYPRPLY